MRALRGGDGGGSPLLVKAPHAHLDLKSPITYITDCKVLCAHACDLCLCRVCVYVICVCRVSTHAHVPEYPLTHLRSIPV